MATRMPAIPSNQPLSSSQFSEAISIVSPSEYLAAPPQPRAANPPQQSRPTSTSKSAHPCADDHQSQSYSQSGSPTSTQPIRINPYQPRRRINRLAPLGFEPPKGYVEPLKGEPLPGRIHHRDDQVKDYHPKGTSGWEPFQERRLALSEAEIGKIDKSWAANGGGVIIDFGMKKTRERKPMQLDTIVEEEWEDEKRDEKEDRKKHKRRDGKDRKRNGKRDGKRKKKEEKGNGEKRAGAGT
ncbi:uncharacterized protein yc1106_01530 [Curvularia clavata]|uniref:Uncharacterized protein n=1 Tax=Curvularia clavata TaxID=95742 RepID=A0A9Q9DQE5_CURCL|nr:uncharacterized protein yc1106_01530 [Curvularia clavata]